MVICGIHVSLLLTLFDWIFMLLLCSALEFARFSCITPQMIRVIRCSEVLD